MFLHQCVILSTGRGGLLLVITSDDVNVDKPKSKRKYTTRGKGRGKTSAKGQVAPPVPVPVPGAMLQKCDMMTETDSDFEEFLQIPEDESVTDIPPGNRSCSTLYTSYCNLFFY